MTYRSSGKLFALSRVAAIALAAASGGRNSLVAEEAGPNQLHEAALQRWLESSKLSASWKLQPVRRSSHPSGSGEVPTLDLVFADVPSESERQQEERFQAFLARYQAENGLSFPDKIFHKFIGTFELSRQNAAVHLHVATGDFVTFVDPKAHELVFRSDPRRAARKSELLKFPLPATTRTLSAHLGAGVSAPELVQKIRALLEDYFKQEYRKAGLRPLDPVPDCDSNHMGLTLFGLRGEVMTDGSVWEKVVINVDMVPEADGLLLTSYIDGFYAGGVIWGRLPSDYPFNMEPANAPQLSYFSQKIFDKIKQWLTKGAP